MTNKILNYPLKYPYLHVSRSLHIIMLVHYYKDQVGTTRFKILSFDVKPTLTLNYAIIQPENCIPCINSTRYSYCSSELNSPIRNRQVIKPFHLQCHPRLHRSNDIALLYSSFFKPQSILAYQPLYTAFAVYFLGQAYGLYTAHLILNISSSIINRSL